MIIENNVLPVLFAVLALMGLTTLAVLLIVKRRIGRRVAEVEIISGNDWSIGIITEPGRRYNLCLSFRIEYNGGEDEYGLTADYTCSSGGSVLVEEKAGVGDLIPKENVRRIGSQYNCDLTAVLGQNRYSATVIICSIGPFQERVELRAAGRLEIAQGTILKKGTFFLST